MREGFWKNFPLAAVMGAGIGFELISVLWVGFPDMVVAPEVAQTAMHLADHNNTREIGKLMYSQYFVAVEIAAVILLVGMFAAIALTLRARKDSKAIDPSIQVKVRAADRLQVVSLPATRPAQQPESQA
jgi:NADH-quinone oxidoreductase subunit J